MPEQPNDDGLVPPIKVLRKRLNGVYSAEGLTGPTRRYVLLVVMLVGLASLPTLAAITAGSSELADGGTTVTDVPFIPPVATGPVLPPSAGPSPTAGPVRGQAQKRKKWYGDSTSEPSRRPTATEQRKRPAPIAAAPTPGRDEKTEPADRPHRPARDDGWHWAVKPARPTRPDVRPADPGPSPTPSSPAPSSPAPSSPAPSSPAPSSPAPSSPTPSSPAPSSPAPSSPAPSSPAPSSPAPSTSAPSSPSPSPTPDHPQRPDEPDHPQHPDKPDHPQHPDDDEDPHDHDDGDSDEPAQPTEPTRPPWCPDRKRKTPTQPSRSSAVTDRPHNLGSARAAARTHNSHRYRFAPDDETPETPRSYRSDGDHTPAMKRMSRSGGRHHADRGHADRDHGNA